MEKLWLKYDCEKFVNTYELTAFLNYNKIRKNDIVLISYEEHKKAYVLIYRVRM